MRTHHLIFILSLLISLVIGILLMGFQLPQDKNALQKRIEFLKNTGDVDSLILYQDLLVKMLEQEGNEAVIERSGQELLEVILVSETLLPVQKWDLLQNNFVVACFALNLKAIAQRG